MKELLEKLNRIITETEEIQKYPSRLNDEYEIAEYISQLASDYVDEELIQDYFRDSYADLKVVSIDSIEEGDPNHNIKQNKKERKYLKMDPNTIPPLVVDNGTIIDGNHRYRVAKQLGLKTIKIYDVQEN